MRSRRNRAEPSYHLQPAHARHHQVLENDHGAELLRQLDRTERICAEVQLQPGLADQHASDQLADHGLVVDQQYDDLLEVCLHGQMRVGSVGI